MGLRINTNSLSLTAQHRLSTSRENLQLTQAKLATGSRIVRPMDDAAGLAISEHLRADIRSTLQNVRNAQNGFYLLQTADGALNEITDLIVRMKELGVQAASDTNGDKERAYLDNEYQALKAELDRICQTTLFNGKPLLDGRGEEIQIQIGPNNQENLDRIPVATNWNVTMESLGIADFEISTVEGARGALEPLGDALNTVAFVRGAIGAGESRITSTMRNLATYEENMSGAFSEIRDADIAFETANLAKYNILAQAGVSVLAQANNSPALALKLLS